LPDFISPITENELAGLACESLIESRIVLENGITAWELRHGPFKDKDFKKLPKTNWTLLVQAVNHWVPQVNDLLNHFNFLPSYYLDDVMVSYAPDKGSVGPHFDYYDVFILQGTGQRHWQLGEFCTPQTPTVAGTQLGILEKFTAVEEYMLEPGDILYIPQQQAHWCIAEKAGLSYSIGFRTPGYGELLNGFCNHVFNQLNESQRIQIEPKSVIAAPAQLTSATIKNLQQIIEKLTQNPQQLMEWAGSYLTEPKYPDLENRVIVKPCGNIIEQLSKHTVLRHNESSRFAYHVNGKVVSLFVDGKYYQYDAAALEFIALLCNNRELTCEVIKANMKNEDQQNLLVMLLNCGALYFQ